MFERDFDVGWLAPPPSPLPPSPPAQTKHARCVARSSGHKPVGNHNHQPLLLWYGDTIFNRQAQHHLNI